MKGKINENIMAISEKFPEKKKRGRPRLLHPEDEKTYRRSMPSRDIRTLQNQDYEVRALSILGLNKINPPDYPFLWLGDISKIENEISERRFYRKTILAELGRIADNENLIEAAKEVCRLKPKTTEAIKMIREWRLGRPAVSTSLEMILRKAIEDYREKHSEITLNNIYKILCSLEDEYFEKSIK